MPPEPVVRDVARLVDGVRAAWPGLRWSRPDQWHLTLTFCGEVSEAKVPELSERLGRAARRGTPMRLAFGPGGAFGGRRRARVVWLGVSGDRRPLVRLADATGAAARRSGIPVDDRPYRPHLTLARARSGPQDVTGLLETLSAYEGPDWTADALRLVRSHLGRHEDRGSVYETVASWPLGGTGAEPLGGTGAEPLGGE